MSSSALEWAYWVNRSAETWWQSMGHAAVQVGIVALGGLILVSLCKRWSSPLRYGILVVLLLKFAVTPVLVLWAPNVAGDLLTVEVPVRPAPVTVEAPRAESPSSVSTTSSSVTEPMVVRDTVLPEPSSAREDPAAWQLITIPGWAWLAQVLGSLAVVLWLVLQSLRLAVWVARRCEPAPETIQALSLEVQTGLRYFKRLDVRVGAEAGSPMAFQLLRPVIVLPQRTIEALSEDELRPVLAHEIAHLKRHDPLVNTLQILLFGIWWFHPLYWWLNRKLRSVREECCDDAVLALAAPGEDRYCQVLLDAARSCQAAVAGRVVLGFGESRSSLKGRIVRIMNPRVSKRARLGWLATGVLAIVVLASMPIWRASASLDRPRPVTKTQYMPGLLELATSGLGLKKYPKLDSAEYAALTDCIDQSRLMNYRYNGVPDFEQPSTRDTLMDLRSRLTQPFYADFLLAKWYEINQEPNEAARWMGQALAGAPVVLVRTYKLMDGRPLAHTPVGRLGVEYRVDTPTMRNANVTLEYVNLTTDEKGRVYLPGFDSRIRCNNVGWPKGYEIETGRHGYLALHARYNLLPTIYAWPANGRRPATTLPTSEFYDYRHAVEAQGLSHRVGLAEFRIDRCYRAGGDGRVTATDGRQRIDASQETLPAFAGHTDVLDQAVVTFERSTLKSHEILQIRVFDHATRGLLTEYHAPADYEYDGDSTIFLRCLGEELPERVDVWFWVTEFSPDQGNQIVPLTVGSRVEFTEYRAELAALHGGRINYRTTTAPNGVHQIIFNDPSDPNAQRTQVAFRIEGKRRPSFDRYARIFLVTKGGQRFFSDSVIRSRTDMMVFEFPAPLSEADHCVLLPIGEERCFYFDGVLLPERSGASPDPTGTFDLEVQTHGQPGPFASDRTAPMRVTVTVVPGRGTMSFSGRSGALDIPRSRLQWQWEATGTYTDKDTHSTVVCELAGLSTAHLEADILDLSGKRLGPGSNAGRGGNVYFQSQPVPLDQLQGVCLRLSRQVDQ